MMNRSAAALLFLFCAAAPAQESPLLSAGRAEEAFTRAAQLVESTIITVPGLARAAAPLVENITQARASLRAAGQRDAAQTYALIGNLRAYLALADALPKPGAYPEEATQQFAELRSGIERIDAHFRALIDDLQARLRQPDRDNLRRYAEANLKVGPPQPANPRVVFLGDSITDGWRLNEYFPDRDFVNRGISGQITGEMLGRMQADVIGLKPAAVLVLAGTNDIARGVDGSAIRNNLAMIAGLAKANGIQVILASVLPVHDYNKDQNPRWERTPARPPKAILELNDWIRDYCRRNGHVCLDYFAAMVDPNGFLKKDLADDGLHPNAAGYRVMAPLAFAAIQKAAPARQRTR